MELKRCPFCGSEATVYGNYNSKANIWFVFVKCEMCGAQGKTHANSGYADPDSEGFWESNSVHAAEKAWNQRV